jgi:hypothetical protein
MSPKQWRRLVIEDFERKLGSEHTPEMRIMMSCLLAEERVKEDSEYPDELFQNITIAGTNTTYRQGS